MADRIMNHETFVIFQRVQGTVYAVAFTCAECRSMGFTHLSSHEQLAQKSFVPRLIQLSPNDPGLRELIACDQRYTSELEGAPVRSLPHAWLGSHPAIQEM